MFRCASGFLNQAVNSRLRRDVISGSARLDLFLTLLAVANGTPVIAARVFENAFSFPFDGDATFRGTRMQILELSCKAALDCSYTSALRWQIMKRYPGTSVQAWQRVISRHSNPKRLPLPPHAIRPAGGAKHPS